MLSPSETLLMGRHVTVYTDHQSLTTLPTQKVLSHHVYHWLEYLENFDYEIKYFHGENNLVADALSDLKTLLLFMLLTPLNLFLLFNFRFMIPFLTRSKMPSLKTSLLRLFFPA